MSMVEAQVESVGFPEYRITTARFRKMIQLGIFGRGDRVFLWHGKLVEKMSKGRRHSYAVLKLAQLLGPLLSARYHLEVEQPLDMEDNSRPEPDLMVVRGPLDDYQVHEPTPHDLGLIVEVADSTVAEDRGGALRDYALAGIPMFWLINLRRRRVEVYTQPSGLIELPGYAIRVDYEADAEVPVLIDGLELGRIGVSILIPPMEA